MLRKEVSFSKMYSCYASEIKSLSDEYIIIDG